MIEGQNSILDLPPQRLRIFVSNQISLRDGEKKTAVHVGRRDCEGPVPGDIGGSEALGDLVPNAELRGRPAGNLKWRSASTSRSGFGARLEFLVCHLKAIVAHAVPVKFAEAARAE
jgi:hypothetical protein